MDFEAITFDSKNDRLVVHLGDGGSREYTRDQAAQYIEDTGREADIVAMGWA